MIHALQKNITVEQKLIPVVKHLNQDKINRFAVTSGATGAIHVDPEYCKNTPYKTTLVHGFLTMAYISEMMEINFGGDWALSGELDVKFISAAKPGDSVIAGGTIKEVLEDRGIVCDVEVVNQNACQVVIGTASLKLRGGL